MKPYRAQLKVCGGTECVSNNSYYIEKALKREIKKQGLTNEIQVGSTSCFGFCSDGPMMIVEPEGIIYHSLTEKDIPVLVKEHLKEGKTLKEKVFSPP